MAGSPRRVELAFDHEGQTFTLVFDMETIARFEDATDISVFDVVAGMGPGKMPKLSVMGSLLQAALAEKHPDVSRTDAMGMFANPQVQALFAEGLASAMPKAGDTASKAEDGKTPTANPPKAGARKKPRAGKGS